MEHCIIAICFSTSTFTASYCPASTGADSIWYGERAPPTFTNAGHGGHREKKNSKQETDQTVLTITKALTKTTNCTFRAKKVEGHDNKHSAFRAGPLPSLPHFQIRSGATASQRHLHYAERNLLRVPRHRLNTYGRRAFATAGPSAWNSLPDPVRNPNSTEAAFMRLL